MAINNPYVPGDPYSYDLKWIVTKLKEHDAEILALNTTIEKHLIDWLNEHGAPLMFHSFDSMAQLITSRNVGAVAFIEGYYTPGDGGACLYYITDDAAQLSGYYVQLDADLYAMPLLIPPYLRPEIFGAKGDGVTDDTAALQAMLAYEGKTFILSKPYFITGTLQMPINSRITAEKSSLLIRGDVAFPLLAAADNADIQVNIRSIDDNVTILSTDDSEIIADGCTNVYIHDCEIQGGDYYGIYVKDSAAVTVENNYIHDYGYAAIMNYGTSENVKILYNTIYNGRSTSTGNRYAIVASTGPNNTAICPTNVICSGNIIEDLTPFWEGISTHGAINLVVTNNSIKNCLSAISITDRAGQLVTSSNITIANNTCEFSIAADLDSHSEQIIVACKQNGATVITGNVITVTADNTGTLPNGTACLRCDVKNAIISGNSVINTVSTRYGVYLFSRSGADLTDYTFTNNVISSPGIGIKLENQALTQISGDIKDNKFIGCATAIDGNEANGPGGDRNMNRNYCSRNTFINCTTEITHNATGTFADWAYGVGSAVGAFGDIVYNVGFNNGGTNTDILFWLCTTPASLNTPATWLPMTRT